MARRTMVRAEKIATTEAVGYIRVSTQDQADSGLGLAAQKARVEAYAVAQGWTLTGMFIDAGVSAKTLDRPELKAAIADLKPGRVLLALKLDRLTRTARDLDELTMSVQANGGEWATVEGNYDTSNAMGRFMLRVIADIAQMEREVTAERTKAALGEKAVRKERLGTTPLGYTTDPLTGKVTVEPEGAETVKIARNLYAEGLSLRKVATELTAQGRKTKRGGAWQAGNVALLLETRYLEEIAGITA